MGEFGVREALTFFESALEEGLPPRVYDLNPEAAASVQDELHWAARVACRGGGVLFCPGA